MQQNTKGNIKDNGKNNTIEGEIGNSFVTINGDNNKIVIGSNTKIGIAKFTIKGNGNTIIIGGNCEIGLKRGFTYFVNDVSNSTVNIENNVRMRGSVLMRTGGGTLNIGKGTIIVKTEFAVMEGKTISVGEGCLFSEEITVHTSDYHSIIDIASGKRINYGKDVMIGERVWVCRGAKILKGTQIPADTIVANGAIVNGKFSETNTIIGGVPAKVIKRGIKWDRKLIAEESMQE